MKGGKRMKISATVVVGDGKGKVGIGHGKAMEVAQAVRKATTRAQKNMVDGVVAGRHDSACGERQVQLEQGPAAAGRRRHRA